MIMTHINRDNIGDFIAKFENVFVCWNNFGSHRPKKPLKISEIFKRKNCGKAIVFAFHFNFTFVSKTYDFTGLYYDLRSFTRDLSLFSIISQFKVIILINTKSYFYFYRKHVWSNNFLQKISRLNRYKTTLNYFFTQK